MTKKIFNPSDWLNNKSQNATTTEQKQITSHKSDIEKVVERIEQSATDVTQNYADWRDLGFAFSQELGEAGRDYFHRISRFYSGYSYDECNKQYDKCLKSSGHGITIKTFFHLAQSSGINVAANEYKQHPVKPKIKGVEIAEKLPLIPDKVYDNLPDFLKKVCHPAQTDEDRDILLLGALTTISSSLPNVYGIYHQRKVFANLYLFLTAKASAGKGLLNHCMNLVLPVHRELREQTKTAMIEYESELSFYNANKKNNPELEKPQKPPEKLLFIPANSSATGVFQLLSDNEGKGLIFETEGDTLANTFKSDYGNYSDGFRKAFHHEKISYYRRTDREYVDIEKPCLSAVLSGTPNQLTNLLPDAENGLFSRFMFYDLEIKPVWKDVFAEPVEEGLENYFDNLGNQFYGLHRKLQSGLEHKFSFTADQKQQFNKLFNEMQANYLNLHGDEYIATIRRLGLIAFRLAMIMTVLRIPETSGIPKNLICSDQDFETTVSILKVLTDHAEKIFSNLPAPVKMQKRKNRKEKFYDALHEQFARQDYVNIAKTMEIPDKTAQGYITDFVKKGFLHRDQKDLYIKPTQ